MNPGIREYAHTRRAAPSSPPERLAIVAVANAHHDYADDQQNKESCSDDRACIFARLIPRNPERHRQTSSDKNEQPNWRAHASPRTRVLYWFGIRRFHICHMVDSTAAQSRESFHLVIRSPPHLVIFASFPYAPRL